MKNCPITEYDLHEFSPNRFPHIYRNRETLNRLVKNGILSRSDKGWMITPFGIAHLHAIAKPYRGEVTPPNCNGGLSGVKTLNKKTKNSKKG